ncbi:unnamed protein product [Trichogramma brassicae]|uniref:Uncharacterized protein n=1 Tax=Trichogramma brassicae TaxID=86971 RepID=A0A6H5IT15_9HYME|nr:unnamed protein product [Trichogramma brassicae]
MRFTLCTRNCTAAQDDKALVRAIIASSPRNTAVQASFLCIPPHTVVLQCYTYRDVKSELKPSLATICQATVKIENQNRVRINVIVVQRIDSRRDISMSVKHFIKKIHGPIRRAPLRVKSLDPPVYYTSFVQKFLRLHCSRAMCTILCSKFLLTLVACEIFLTLMCYFLVENKISFAIVYTQFTRYKFRPTGESSGDRSNLRTTTTTTTATKKQLKTRVRACIREIFLLTIQRQLHGIKITQTSMIVRKRSRITAIDFGGNKGRLKIGVGAAARSATTATTTTPTCCCVSRAAQRPPILDVCIVSPVSTVDDHDYLL